MQLEFYRTLKGRVPRLGKELIETYRYPFYQKNYSYKVCREYKGHVYICKMVHSKSWGDKDCYRFTLNVGDFSKLTDKLYISSLEEHFTRDSIASALRFMPVLRDYEMNNLYKGINLLSHEYALAGLFCFAGGTSELFLNECGELSEGNEIKWFRFLVDFTDDIINECVHFSFDTKALVKKERIQIEKPKSDLPPWLTRAFYTGARVGIKFLAQSIGSDYDLPIPDFDSGDFVTPDFDYSSLDFDCNYESDFETNGVFDDFELELSDSDNYTESTDYSNVTFGQKAHVKQIGGGLGEGEVDIDKKPGTAHTWIVKQSGKVIAEIKSLSEVFYVPGIGRCKIS